MRAASYLMNAQLVKDVAEDDLLKAGGFPQVNEEPTD